MFGAISLLLLISFILNLIIVASIFYIAGRIIIGRKNVSFRAAFLISLLGTVIGSIFVVLLPLVV